MRGALLVVRRVAAASSARAPSTDHRTPPFALGSDPIFNPNAAADVLSAKKIMSKADFQALDAGYRRYAFTVARVDSERLIATVQERLTDALCRGLTRQDFAKAVDDAFDAAGVTKLNPYHVQTVFETNVMSSYSAANWDMLHHPDVAELFPMYHWDALGDDRLCPICAPYDGVTLPPDDPFWASHWPLLHHRCRCTVSALNADQAAGVNATAPGEGLPPPSPGFGAGGGAAAQWRTATAISPPSAPGLGPTSDVRAVIDRGLARIGPSSGNPRAEAKALLRSLAEPGKDRVPVAFGSEISEDWKKRIRRQMQDVYNLLPPALRETFPLVTVGRSASGDSAWRDDVILLGRQHEHSSEAALRRVVFHEYLHHVHHHARFAQTDAMSLIEQHWKARTAGETVGRLRGYEAAYPLLKGKNDKWVEGYVGRVYKWEAGDGKGLEVLSQNGEYFRNPGRLAELIRRDRETASLVVGILKGLAG